MKISAEFRMPVAESTKRRCDSDETRTTDDGIPGETLSDVDVISCHLREALLLCKQVRPRILYCGVVGQTYRSPGFFICPMDCHGDFIG